MEESCGRQLSSQEAEKKVEEMAANQEQWDATSDRDMTEVLKILDDIDAYLEDEIAVDVKQMQYTEVNQSENYICDNSKMLEDIRKAEEEFQHELESLNNLCEKTEKQRQEWDAKTKQEETEKQQQERNAKTSQEETEEQHRYWDELRKKRIKRVYIGIEVQCKLLRNIDIDTWFAIKPAIEEEDKGVYVGIEVLCKFLRKVFKIGLW